MKHGNSINYELTTKEGADIPFHRKSNRRKVAYSDVLAYKEAL